MHEEFEQLIEAEWAGALDEAARAQLVALANAEPALTARLGQERRLSGLLGRLGPNRAPAGLAQAVFARLDAGETIEEAEETEDTEEMPFIAAPAGREPQKIPATAPEPAPRPRARVIGIGQAMQTDQARRQRPRLRWQVYLRWAMAALIVMAVGIESSIWFKQEKDLKQIIRVSLKDQPAPPPTAQEDGKKDGTAENRQEWTVAAAAPTPEAPRPSAPTEAAQEETAAKRAPAAKAKRVEPAEPAKKETQKETPAEPDRTPVQSRPTRVSEPAAAVAEKPAPAEAVAPEPATPIATPAPEPPAVPERVVAKAEPEPAVDPSLADQATASLNTAAVESAPPRPEPTPAATAPATVPPAVPTLAERTLAQADTPRRPAATAKRMTPTPAAPRIAPAAAPSAPASGAAGDGTVVMSVTLASAGGGNRAATSSTEEEDESTGLGRLLDAAQNGQDAVNGPIEQSFNEPSPTPAPRSARPAARQLTQRDIEIAIARAGGEIVRSGRGEVVGSLTAAQARQLMATLGRSGLHTGGGAAGRYQVTQGGRLLNAAGADANRKITLRIVIRQVR